MSTQSALATPARPALQRIPAGLRWWLFSLGMVWLGGLLPLARNVGYYFVDDSQVDMYGKLWQIGHRLTLGDWSLVNPHAWQAGNYVAEQYWGVHSPLLWVLGLVAFVTPNALVAMTGLKMVLFGIAASGIYLLGRSYGAIPPLASLAAIAAPLAGFTLYMDAATWMNGFTAWAFVPLTWWALLRFWRRQGVVDGSLALGLVYTVVSINYVHASIVLGLFILALGIQSLRSRHRRRTAASIGLGIFWLLCCVAIHLPGVLTAPASGRSSSIGNDGFLVADLTGYATAGIGSGAAHVGFFGETPQDFANAPLMYIAWFLPLASLVDVRRARALISGPLASIAGVGLVLALFTMAPSELGPLRFPIRLLPYVAVAALVVLAVLLSRARLVEHRRSRLALASAAVGIGWYLTWAQSPWYWEWIALVAIIAGAGCIIVFIHLRGAAPRWNRVIPIMAICTLLIVGIQHVPAPASPLMNYRVPTDVAAYRGLLPHAEGDTIIVGNPAAAGPRDPAVYRRVAVGNLWYLSDTSVQNLYTAVYNPPYNQTVCMNNFGATCGELYDRLFSRMPSTGEQLVDLLSVSTVVVLKDAVAADALDEVPAGWAVRHDDGLHRVLTRVDPVPPAGAVVWTSAGVSISDVRSTAMRTTFHVDAVPGGGGQLALSRIPWPGYRVSGASLSTNLKEGFLMQVNISAESVGTDVVVEYRMPGEGAILLAFALMLPTAAILLLGARRRWVFFRRPVQES
jgi:hypothetical protein